MPALKTTNELLNIIIKMVLLAAIALFIVWCMLSFVANAAEDKAIEGPDVEYRLFIPATGQVLYTDDYEHPSDKLHILNGYWELSDGKYRERDTILPLDERYFGDIIVEKRR